MVEISAKQAVMGFFVFVAVALIYYATIVVPSTPVCAAKSQVESLVASSKACFADWDCEVVQYSCKYGAVNKNEVAKVTAAQRAADACDPQICQKSVVIYDAYCDKDKLCQVIESGYSDKLFEDLLVNRTECSNSNVSGYADADQCFVALRLKSRYKPQVVQDLICARILDARVRGDCETMNTG